MKTFKDNGGRVWTISVNVTTMRQVKDLLGVDLMEVVNGTLLENLMNDPVLLCNVVYCICKDEAEKAGISDEEFGWAMAGEAIDAATEALLEELVAFFPESRRRLLTAALGKLQALQQKAATIAETYIESPALEKKMEEALSKAWMEVDPDADTKILSLGS